MDKKIIIIGLISACLLGGGIWYFSQKPAPSEPEAAVNESSTEPSGELVTDPVIGDPEAPVTMIEYSTHLCGHCVRFHQETLPLIIEKYIKTGQVKLIPRTFPPLELGQSVLCAHEQGKFLEYNDYVFEHAGELQSADGLKTFAANLGLETEQFNQCFDSKKYEERVQEWYQQGQEAGVTGTPTFFINDQKIVGNLPVEEFERVIEEELNQ